MDVVVRHADLSRDSDQIIDLHRKLLTSSADRKRFEWLYKRNPFGQARVWVIENSMSNAVIGTAAAFPRSLWNGLRREIGWVLGDFCISEDYRSLGPAIQLQRACLEGLGTGESIAWYDFPSASMLSIYKRLKFQNFQKMTRFVKPLRVDRKVRAMVKSDLLQKCLSRLGNQALRWTSKRGRVPVPEDLKFAYHKGECGEEFTQLAESIGGNHGNCLERTASYLNWRYIHNPLYRCELVAARMNDTLKGYVVFTDRGSEGTLIDLFGVHEKPVLVGLINCVVDMVRTRNWEILNVPIIEGHPWVPFLQVLGFQARETCPIIISGLSTEENEGKVPCSNRPPLLLMQGDRDM